MIIHFWSPTVKALERRSRVLGPDLGWAAAHPAHAYYSDDVQSSRLTTAVAFPRSASVPVKYLGGTTKEDRSAASELRTHR